MPDQTTYLTCINCKSSDVELYAYAKDVEYFTNDKSFAYYTCNSCNVLFIDPVPLNELNEIYPNNYYSFTNKTKGLSFKLKQFLDRLFFKKIFRQLPQANLSVLDLGGGTGWLIDSIKAFEPRIHFSQIVDIDEKADVLATEKGHHYFKGVFENFQSDRKFQVILMLNFIEHVANPQETLRKAESLLDDNGIIIIKTPNYNSLDARIFRNKNWGGFHCPRHWVIFDESSARTMFTNCNLKVASFRYTQGAPFWTVSILHGLQKRGIIKASKDRPLIYHPLFSPISIITAAFDFARKPFAPLSQMFFTLKKTGHSFPAE